MLQEELATQIGESTEIINKGIVELYNLNMEYRNSTEDIVQKSIASQHALIKQQIVDEIKLISARLKSALDLEHAHNDKLRRAAAARKDIMFNDIKEAEKRIKDNLKNIFDFPGGQPISYGYKMIEIAKKELDKLLKKRLEMEQKAFQEYKNKSGQIRAKAEFDLRTKLEDVQELTITQYIDYKTLLGPTEYVDGVAVDSSGQPKVSAAEAEDITKALSDILTKEFFDKAIAPDADINAIIAEALQQLKNSGEDGKTDYLKLGESVDKTSWAETEMLNAVTAYRIAIWGTKYTRTSRKSQTRDVGQNKAISKRLLKILERFNQRGSRQRNQSDSRFSRIAT